MLLLMREEINMEVQGTKTKVIKLLKLAFSYYGKEILLPSKQYFNFIQINDQENSIKGKYDYQIQYGFPQSGSVIIKFSYFQKEHSFSVDKISVFAPSADKLFDVVNFVPQVNIDELGISANFGLDIDTKEHTSSIEIEQNPNALKMLDMAINDLSQATILGKCCLEVSEDSDTIPLCYVRNEIINKEKR